MLQSPLQPHHLLASSANAHTHTSTHTRVRTLACIINVFTSKSWQFSDDIHTPPGSNNISPASVSIIKYFKQRRKPPTSASRRRRRPPGDRRRYLFCQSHFPCAFVTAARVYELSIAVSGCKITDVLRGGIGWDYLGLSINAYSHPPPPPLLPPLLPPVALHPPHYSPINLAALRGGGSGCGWNVFAAALRVGGGCR